MHALSKEQLRVLRFLKEGQAHEFVERPLQAPLYAIEKGWAEYGPVYDGWLGRRRVQARTIRITEAGRRALASSLSEEG